ncbi:MAG: class I tRNA ligase family protein, partial [Candidatus Brocadiia bacterium]|nr:class I tRNA ligase family protein [Candidatus Brocadiia bacterium]
MNYKETINLPKTAFSMKAGLARLEPQVQKQWDEMGLYKMIREARAGREKYVLHDGPPYPTGDLHIGTGLNKVLKDFIVRFHTMRGHDAPYVPGWDCHGLPIEVKVLEELGERRETTSKSEIRARCRDYALKYVEVQKRQFKSLGVSGDWDAPYLTINRGYEAGVLEVFAEMVAGGFVTRDLKPVHWCYHCGTVLAEAELEYEDIEGPSIYVNFPVAAEQPDGA